MRKCTGVDQIAFFRTDSRWKPNIGALVHVGTHDRWRPMQLSSIKYSALMAIVFRCPVTTVFLIFIFMLKAEIHA
jgi:hypothetical protein